MQKIVFFIIFLSFFLQTHASADYIVKRGDTLSTIAYRHHMSIRKLIALNHLKKHSILKIGKKLHLFAPIAMKQTKKRTLQKDTKQTVDDVLLAAIENKNVYIYQRDKEKKVHSSRHTKRGRNIIDIAKTKLGRRYVWGAVGQRGTFDCSGFTSYVYKKKGIHIPRTSLRQSRYGKYIARRALRKGDLIFFDTSRRRKGYVNHVGIYLGNGKFIHASSAKKKVVVSDLSKFYARRYVGARRPS